MAITFLLIVTIIYVSSRYFLVNKKVFHQGLNLAYAGTIFTFLFRWYTKNYFSFNSSLNHWVDLFFYLAVIYFALKVSDQLLVDYYLIRIRDLYIAPQLRNTIFLIIYLLAVLIIARNIWHLNPTAILAIPTVLTAGIALAFQDTLKTFIAGIFLNKVIHLGDWIAFGNYQGEVTAMDWVRTTIRTRDGDHIFILNSVLAASDIYNFSLHYRNHRCSIKLGVSYQHPPHLVKAALREATRNIPEIISNPPVEVYLEQYSDFSIIYGLYFWINDYARYQRIMDEVASRIWYIFRRHNIEIPYPIRTIIPTQKSSGTAETAETKYSTVAIIEQMAIFQPLDQKDREFIARMARIQTFYPREVIIQQGEPGSNFYVIVSGKVGIYFTGDGQTRLVKTLKPQQYFGEISLLTGELCTATVIAQETTSVLMLSRKIFDQIITSKPEIVEHLATELAHRSEELQIIAEQIKQQKDSEKISPETLVKKIRKFFRLN